MQINCEWYTFASSSVLNWFDIFSRNMKSFFFDSISLNRSRLIRQKKTMIWRSQYHIYIMGVNCVRLVFCMCSNETEGFSFEVFKVFDNDFVCNSIEIIYDQRWQLWACAPIFCLVFVFVFSLAVLFSTIHWIYNI